MRYCFKDIHSKHAALSMNADFDHVFVSFLVINQDLISNQMCFEVVRSWSKPTRPCYQWNMLSKVYSGSALSSMLPDNQAASRNHWLPTRAGNPAGEPWWVGRDEWEQQSLGREWILWQWGLSTGISSKDSHSFSLIRLSPAKWLVWIWGDPISNRELTEVEGDLNHLSPPPKAPNPDPHCTTFLARLYKLGLGKDRIRLLM